MRLVPLSTCLATTLITLTIPATAQTFRAEPSGSIGFGGGRGLS